MEEIDRINLAYTQSCVKKVDPQKVFAIFSLVVNLCNWKLSCLLPTHIPTCVSLLIHLSMCVRDWAVDWLPYVNGGTICTPVNYSTVCDLNPGPTQWHMYIVSALHHSTKQACYKLAVRWYIYSCVYRTECDEERERNAVCRQSSLMTSNIFAKQNTVNCWKERQKDIV